MLSSIGAISKTSINQLISILGLRDASASRNFQIIVTNAMLSRYNPNIEIRKGSRPPLNPDHTHFIMVDDGYRNRLATKNHKKVSNM